MQHKEFYEYGLLAGVHYVQAATADDVPAMGRETALRQRRCGQVATADDVPAMVRYLREHDSYARAVASLGRARLRRGVHSPSSQLAV